MRKYLILSIMLAAVAIYVSGCNEAQGFFIGRPVPATHLVQTIRDFEATQPKRRGDRLTAPMPNLPMLADESSDEIVAEED